jgi:adenosylcobinamide-phosphate synthase
MNNLGVIAGALVLEAIAGYPPALAHPVMWIGTLIAWLDRRRPAGARRGGGIVALLVIVVAAALPAALLQVALPRLLPSWLAWPLLVLAASTLLAQRSLYQHVAEVGVRLRHDGLAGGRVAVAHIVGRNPASLDEPAIVRAALESLAENFSDAVVAPALWGALAGLPGIAVYKAINTADSMIGHRTPRHAAFGWASARLDDLVNLPASRLAAVWLVLAACLQRGASPRRAVAAVLRDARHHRSPNAGWPEAALAGALGLRIGGPRVYGDTLVDVAWMGDGRGELGADDIIPALALYRTACALQMVAAMAAWLLTLRS